jgi:cathepsin B
MLFTTTLLLGLVALSLGENVEQPKVSENGNKLLELAQMKLAAQSLVDEVNSKQSLWKAEFNSRFAYMDLEDKRRMMGVRMDGKRVLSKKPKVPKVPKVDAGLPATYDARDSPVCKDVISQIQDQSVCGSCWAVAAASAMSDRICVKSGGKIKVDISALDLMSCETYSYGCNGGWPEAAWRYFSVNGLVTGGNYTEKSGCRPYPFPPAVHPSHEKTYKTPKCQKTCQKSYGETYKKDLHYAKPYDQVQLYDEQEIRDEIYKNGPVEAAFSVYDDFAHYKSGVYQHTSGKYLGGHAVRIIGWGEEKGTKYWLVANSWNTYWGENGLFKIIRGTDDCGFESEITFGEPDLERSM